MSSSKGRCLQEGRWPICRLLCVRRRLAGGIVRLGIAAGPSWVGAGNRLSGPAAERPPPPGQDQGLQRASEWGDQSASAARGRRAAAAVATGVWWSGAGGARDLAASCCSACGAGSTAERVAVQRWRAVRRRLAPPTSAPPVGRRLLCQGPLTLAVLPVRSAGASAVPAPHFALLREHLHFALLPAALNETPRSPFIRQTAERVLGRSPRKSEKPGTVCHVQAPSQKVFIIPPSSSLCSPSHTHTHDAAG